MVDRDITSSYAMAAAVARRALRPVLQRWRASSTSTTNLPGTMSYLRDLRTGNEVYLIGTAHVSKKSAEEVRDVIQAVRPDTVFVELCEKRAASIRRSMLQDDGASAPGGGVEDKVKEFLRVLGCVASLLLFVVTSPDLLEHDADVSFSRAPGDVAEKLLGAGLKSIYQAFRTYGLDPGLEFKVAIEEAEKIGAKLVMGDRDQEVTIRRLREALTMSDFLRAMFSGGTIPTDHMPPDLAERFSKIDWNDPEAAVEMMKTRRAVAEVTRHLRTDFPKVAVAMVDERDEMMTNGLLHKCPGRTVAVVGMAHMDGIEARWRAAQGGEGGVTQLSQ